MPLSRRHWIFDMDGTLTIAAHDFDQFKEDHNLNMQKPILEQLPSFSQERRDHILQSLVDWEKDIANRAKLAPDALPLLQHLKENGHRLAILTRNTRPLAFRTLQQANIAHFFEEETVLGRSCAEPKPSPDGVNRILKHWNAQPNDAVMVGDYLFDLDAGRAAGVFCIYIDRKNSQMWQDHADLTLTRLDRILDEEQ